ncbi:MAG: hypothetical protein HYX96_09260 [Chloroflexi bacterium]|nr:hypothetical protein [Chloroflexota bacterium]
MPESEKSSILRLRITTKERLDQLRHPGQSYDGILEEIIDFWHMQHSQQDLHQMRPPTPYPPAATPAEMRAKELSWWWPPSDRTPKNKK